MLSSELSTLVVFPYFSEVELVIDMCGKLRR